MTSIPKDRAARIELAAALMFGRDEHGGAEKGWRAKLARAMSTRVSTIASTLEQQVSPPFDRKLYPLLRTRAAQMRIDADTLESLADVIETEAEPKKKD